MKFTAFISNKYYVLLLLVCLSWVVQAQSCPTSPASVITLTSQTQVDEFAQNYDVANCNFPGEIRIQDGLNTAGGVITNLDGLAGINEAFRIQITQNPGLTSISGLSTLSTLSDLSITTCPQLISLQGLEGLTQIGDVFINGCNSLTDLSGLENLESTDAQFAIFDCNNLTSFNGLSSLETISGQFRLGGCDNLLNVDALATVSEIGTISISDAAALQTLAGFSGLITVENIGIGNCPQVASLVPLASVSGDISGFVSLSNMPLVQDLSPLGGITRVQRGINLFNMDGLTDLNGLNDLLEIDYLPANPNNGSLSINECDNLSDISGIANLTFNGDEITLTNNPILSACSVGAICDVIDDPAVTFTISGNGQQCSSQAVIEQNCSEAFVPDDAFEQALIDRGLDVGPLDDYVPLQNISTVTNLNVDNEGISDLTGIADFVLLEVFSAAGNQVTFLDLSANINLTSVDLNNNDLAEFILQNGNNSNILSGNFNTLGNPDLFCIAVDDPAYATANWTDTDAQVSFAQDCCAAPAGVTFTDVTSFGATINWNLPVPSLGFPWDVFISDNNTQPSPGTIPTAADLSSMSLSWNEGQPNTTYYVWVRTDCTTGGDGEISEWNGPFNFTTNSPCTQPSLGFTVIPVSQTGAEITIQDNSLSTGNYDLYISATGVVPSIATPPTVDGLPAGVYTWTGGTSNTNYTVYARADCGEGNFSQWTFQREFKTWPTCGDEFTDSAGADGDLVSFTTTDLVPVTICPDNPAESVIVTFKSFDMQISSGTGCRAGLQIFDGPNDAAPPILAPSRNDTWCWDVEANPPTGSGDLTGMAVNASNPSGCLTFKIRLASPSEPMAGWTADVTCEPLGGCFTDASLTDIQETSTSIFFAWMDNGGSGTENFDVYFSDINGGGVVVPQADTPPTGNDLTGSFTWTGATPETTYAVWIRADCDQDNTTAPRWRLVTFRATPALPIPNGECSTAIDLTAASYDGLVTIDAGRNFPSTQGGMLAPPTGGCNTFNSWCDAGVQQDAWFKVTIPAGTEDLGYFYVSTLGSTFDTQVAIWDDCNGNLISANDDFFGSGNGFTSLTTAAVQPGNTYYIQVDGYNGALGDISLSLYYVPLVGPAASEAGVVSATSEATGADGWTHYVDPFTTPATIIASVNKQGNDLGWLSITPGFSVVQEATGGTLNLGIAATPDSECADVNTPYVFNDDWWVMRRTWDVTPAVQPTSPVLVRSYYTTEDFTAVADQLPEVITQHTDLTHYKITGADESLLTNPCHETIQPGNYQEFDGGQYTYGTFGTGHYAEFEISSFSGGGGGGGTGATGAFPIELAYFRGNKRDKTNYLSWVSVMEEAAEAYILERSSTTENWETLSVIPAAGNSQEDIEYGFLDQTPPALSYYRLRMVDLDGSFEYSDIVSIIRAEAVGLRVIPNPAQGASSVRVLGATAGATIELIAMDGRPLTSLISSGDGTYRVPNLPTGVYILSCVGEDGKPHVSRLVIK